MATDHRTTTTPKTRRITTTMASGSNCGWRRRRRRRRKRRRTACSLFRFCSPHCKHAYPHRRTAIDKHPTNSSRQEFFESCLLLTKYPRHLARGHLAKSHDLAQGLCFSGPTNPNFAAFKWELAIHRMLLEAIGHCFLQAAEALGRATSRLGAEPQRRS